MSTQNTFQNLTPAIVEAIQDRKGKKISVLDLSAIEGAPASEFIICQANSPTQVAAIADNIREQLLDNLRVKPYNYDGYRNSEWIVVDYGDILVHIFYHQTREHYNLEELWSDAPITEIPDID